LSSALTAGGVQAALNLGHDQAIRLESVLEQEFAALGASDLQAFEALQARKDELIGALTALIGRFDSSAANWMAQAGPLELSDAAKQMLTEPAFDSAKVETIKRAIADGNYPLNARRMAESFSALESMIDGIVKTLKKGQTITFVGFGTFKTSIRKARLGRNPQNGKTVKIPKRRVARFSAGKGLKDILN